MRIGAFYLLKGGHILRYQGLWGGKGPCLAFLDPSYGVSEPPVGASVAPSDVLREISVESIPELQRRIQQMRVRNLHEASTEIEVVLQELTPA